MRAQQLVRMSDGTVRTYEDAGRLRYTPSPSHTHWHLLDFQRYELRTLDGELVVRDRKSGFCLADHYGLARRRVTAFTGGHFFGNCAASNPQALSVEQGTSIGFTDLYPAHFHGQNLELQRRARRDLPARPPRQPDAAARGDRLHEQRGLAPHPPHLARRRPEVETLRRCEGSADC